MAGCVLCRREAQSANSPSSPGLDASPRPLLGPLLAAAALCFAAGLAFDLVEGAIARSAPPASRETRAPERTTPQQEQLDQALRELTGGNPNGLTSASPEDPE